MALEDSLGCLLSCFRNHSASQRGRETIPRICLTRRSDLDSRQDRRDSDGEGRRSLEPRPGVKPRNVENKIDLLGSARDFERARAADPELFSPLEERLNQDSSFFEDAWEKIR